MTKNNRKAKNIVLNKEMYENKIALDTARVKDIFIKLGKKVGSTIQEIAVSVVVGFGAAVAIANLAEAVWDDMVKSFDD